jgi:hypothetical protein
MGDSNKILASGNTFLAVSNIAGTRSGQQQLQGLPLGTSDGTATGELGAKVIVVGTGGGAGAVSAISSTTASGATVTTGSTLLLAAASNRKYAILINTGAVDAWLSLDETTDPAASTGIYLKAGGGSYEITAANLWRGSIYGITASSTTNVAVMQGV